MRSVEDLDELDKGEITDGFRRDAGGNFDRDRNLVVHHFGFELVRIAGSRVL